MELENELSSREVEREKLMDEVADYRVGELFR